MKKRFKQIVAFGLAVLMLLASCDSSTKTPSDSTTTETENEYTFEINDGTSHVTDPEESTTEPETTELGEPSSAEPETTTAEPETTTAEPETTTAEPETTTAEPETTTAEPETTTAEPETTTAEPETTTAEPETTTAEPETTTAEPETTTAEPETTTAEPETTTAEPETTTAEPETTTAEPETTTAEPETTTAEPETTPSEPVVKPEKSPYDAFTCGSCGYISSADNHNIAGVVCYDALVNQNSSNIAADNYLKDGTLNGKVFTIKESGTTLTISGWVGMDTDNYEFAWRIGTHNETVYRNWSVTTNAGDKDVIAAANKAGYKHGVRFVYYLGTEAFNPGDKIHLFIKDKDTGLVYCFSEFILTRPGKAECGNLSASENKNAVGTVRIDALKNTNTNTLLSIQNYTTTATVSDPKNEVFTMVGWLPTNLTSYELAFRVGTDNAVAYRNWSVSEITRESAVTEAAQGEGYAKGVGYQYNFGFDGFADGDVIHLFIKDKTTGNVYCFCEITVHIKKVTVSTAKKYALGAGSSHVITAYDPITNKETPSNPTDDATLKMWFDHITEKVARYDISKKDSATSSYTIQMAKNEMEACQFFLYSPTERKVTIKVTDFANEKGETLETELGVEFYIEDGYLPLKGFTVGQTDAHGKKVDVYPDAVIPYESYIKDGYGGDEGGSYEYGTWVPIGPYSYKPWDLGNYPYRDTVRGFVVQATTTKDTTPGAYKATVEIYDHDTGTCIKKANVYTYVYDVTLSEETAMDTAFGIWGEYYMQTYSNYGGYNDIEVIKAMADFMLKYRMTPNFGAWTLENVLCANSDNTWLYNPRVTTFKVYTKEMYDRYKNDPILASKMIYYGQDEPAVPRNQYRSITLADGSKVTYFDQFGILSILGVAEEAKMLESWGWEDYRLVIPYERNPVLTNLSKYPNIQKNGVIPNMSWAAVEAALKDDGAKALYNKYKSEIQTSEDMVEFLREYVTVWTYLYAGSTPRQMKSYKAGSIFMQDESLDAILDEYATRMSKYQAQGDELWAYVACEPQWNSPYQNILLFNDGTEGRTMFWTSYMLGQTGFLYWREDYYGAANTNTYSMRVPFSATGPGDGILFYPGAVYGQVDPIPSIRFINMRDGIEEYQMLTMLEEYKGSEFTDQLVSHVVTSTVTFEKNDSNLYNIRSYLLRQLEAATK